MGGGGKLTEGPGDQGPSIRAQGSGLRAQGSGLGKGSGNRHQAPGLSVTSSFDYNHPSTPRAVEAPVPMITGTIKSQIDQVWNTDGKGRPYEDMRCSRFKHFRRPTCSLSSANTQVRS